LFDFPQDDAHHYALGQITEVRLRNVWHEDPTMRSLIRQRGRVDQVSERQDTHLAKMTISAVFKEGGERGYEPSILGTVPSTGTPIAIVEDEILQEVLKPYRDQLFYFGHVYGSKPQLPLWFKHFGSGPDGAGEAYHVGIFGKTGSGKSVLAKMALVAYARHKQMGLLIIDPQGEFARDMRGETQSGEFELPLKAVFEHQGKKPFVMTVRNIVLDRWSLFEQIIYESRFFEQLTLPKGENRELAAMELSRRLQKARVKLADLHTRESFDRAWRLLLDPKVQTIIYKSEGPRTRLMNALEEADRDEFYSECWKPVVELFTTFGRVDARTVERALDWVLNPDSEEKHALVVDLSRENAVGLYWNDEIQALVIKRILDGLLTSAERLYRDGKSLNSLVVIDEAHRLAPRRMEKEENGNATERAVRGTLIDAVRTTRKYGLGWLFVSQTLSSLHPEIIQQLRIFFFGFGLGLGQEFQSLRDLVGGSGPALDLYQLFRDPHSAFDVRSRQYSFMTIGPVSPLSFSGTPLFFNAFNRVDGFLTANGLGDLVRPSERDLEQAG
ncbi:MAG: ATP-binding protein, partial [Coriobacteriia bacterium]|nr:ATP-binding protein [Coriobacteriia bacterium]